MWIQIVNLPTKYMDKIRVNGQSKLYTFIWYYISQYICIERLFIDSEIEGFNVVKMLLGI